MAIYYSVYKSIMFLPLFNCFDNRTKWAHLLKRVTRAYARTHARTNERRNERTNERTNDRSKEQAHTCPYAYTRRHAHSLKLL